jgi:hypothetical protein
MKNSFEQYIVGDTIRVRINSSKNQFFVVKEKYSNNIAVLSTRKIRTIRLNISVVIIWVMDSKRKEEEGQENKVQADSLLTLSNIQYLVEGLDSLLHTNLDGDKRAKVIKLRDELSAYISGMFV